MVQQSRTRRSAPAARGDGGDLDFAQATLDEVTELVELVERAYRGEASLEGWTSEAHLLGGQRCDADMVRELVDAAGSMVLVARERATGELIACANLKWAGEVCEFGMFAVEPGRQGGGIGAAMLDRSVSLAGSWGCARVEMTVIAQREELIGFYLRHGFVHSAESRPFPYGDERYGQPTRDDLFFVVLHRQVGEPTGASGHLGPLG